jgi:Ca2+-binding EF-hand superfamily protein
MSGSSSKLKQLSEGEIKEIAEESGVDPDVIRSWYKEFLQVCPSGNMNKKNFYKFYKILRGGGSSDANLHKITDYVFSSFDKDNNGSLSFSGELLKS